ncbi:hypothetical protein D9M68_272230 [compost metagenome]
MNQDLQKQLANKRILLIAPRFFGYEKALRETMERHGALVDYWLDKPSNTLTTKALVRLRPTLVRAQMHAYVRRIASSTVPYDVVLIIKGEAFDKEAIRMMRHAWPDARFIYYTWDSFKNYPHLVPLLPLFDQAYSFDSAECKSIPNLRHIPLFFVDKYRNLSTEQIEYDLCSIASVHSDRYPVIQRIKQAAPSGSRSYEYYFYPSRRAFLARKYLDRNFHAPPIDAVQFQPLAEDRLLDTLRKCKVVVDVQHPGQTGLTMRTLEMVGARKKLVTTNPRVKEYDFYDPDNILIVDRDNPAVPESFLASPYRRLPEEIYEKYSVVGWLSRLLSPD